MRIISVNKDQDPNLVSETDNLFDFNEHELKLSPSDIYQDFPQERVLLLVHGYNSEYARAYNAYRTISQRLRHTLTDKTYEIVGFTWPGGDSPVDYFPAKSRAKKVANRLSYHIAELYYTSGCKKVDILCHSMGCLLTFEAMLKTQDGIVGNIFAAAPAVDNESIQIKEEYGACVEKTERMVVMYSNNDSVLKYSYSIAEMDQALGLKGVEKIGKINQDKLSLVDCTALDITHNAYKTTPELYKLIDLCYNYNKNIPLESGILDYQDGETTGNA